MSEHPWRDPSEAERALAADWIAAWNAVTGDTSSLPAGWRAAKDCACGCPTFAVTPVVLKQPECRTGPLPVHGSASTADGASLAGLVAFWADEILHIEVYSLVGPMPELEQLTFTLESHPS